MEWYKWKFWRIAYRPVDDIYPGYVKDSEGKWIHIFRGIYLRTKTKKRQV